MDTGFLRKRAHTVKSLEEFLGYCAEHGYNGSVAILKGMLDDTKKIHPEEVDGDTKPALRSVSAKLSLEQRQIQAVIMILHYVLNEHPFLTLSPKISGNSITVENKDGLEVKYQIQFEGSWTGAELYQTIITVNPKWVIRISTIVTQGKFVNMKITSNFGKGYFGMESVEGEFNFKNSTGREEASNFIYAHLHDVAHAVQKSNV